jgi:hypothetical protein
LNFGSWLRTMKLTQSPSELVVMQALTRTLPEFLTTLPDTDSLKKFLADKLDWSRCPMFRLTG